MEELKLQALALPQDLICCFAKIARLLCSLLPPNANPQVRALLCSWASFLEALCAIYVPGTAGG